MEHPIMKGVAERSNTGEKFPYIAIKVRSLRNRAELVEQWEMSPEILPCLGDVSKPIESVIVLYQYIQDKPLMWDELGIADLCRPQFFTGNFTFPEDGGISRSQQKHIPPFRDLVVEGVGADCKGVRWQVIGHPKQASVV
jgi:hypothetical protein